MRAFMAHTSGMLSTLQVHFARLVAATAPQPQAPPPDPAAAPPPDPALPVSPSARPSLNLNLNLDPAAAPPPNLGLPGSPSARPSPMPPSARVAAPERLASSGVAGTDSAAIASANPGSPSPGGAGSERANVEPGSPDAAHAAAAEALAGDAWPCWAAAGQLGALMRPAQGLQAPEQPRVGPRPAPYGGTPAARPSSEQHARPALSRIQGNSSGCFAASGSAGPTNRERSHAPDKACGVGLPMDAAGPGGGQRGHEAALAGGSLTGAATPAECWHRRCESGPALRSAAHGQRHKPQPAAAGKLVGRQAALARGMSVALPWGGGPAEAEAGEHAWPCDALC